jgi:hypothetical protein
MPNGTTGTSHNEVIMELDRQRQEGRGPARPNRTCPSGARACASQFARSKGILPFLALVSCAGSAQAGMTVYDLTDVARLRLEDISFFAFLLLLATLGIRLLWNSLAKDFPRLPRLSLLKAFSLTALLGLLMLLMLVMISGARELLTPGAWHRQASHYRPNESGNRELRQQSLEGLRAALLQYAHGHEGRLPPHDYVAELPAKVWEAPDSAGTRYLYVGGLTLSQTNAVLVCEPRTFGDERFVLFVDGAIKAMKTEEVHRLMGAKEQP